MLLDQGVPLELHLKGAALGATEGRVKQNCSGKERVRAGELLTRWFFP